MKGKIVLIPFPFTDLTTTKLRPALVLHEGKGDVVVAFISSRISAKPLDTDVVVMDGHPEYRQTGLKTSSTIRLDKIATVVKTYVMGEIGELGSSLKNEVNVKLR